MPLPSLRVSVRPWPHPFRASLTLCGDADWFPFEAFDRWHRFLNTLADTAYGPGLGLEIGDSFWMYTAGGGGAQGFSYFDGTSDRPGPHAECLRQGIASGYLDCLHTYGDFNQIGGFRRELAERAVKELIRHGLGVPVWIDHGGPHNLQNFNALGLGDVPKETCADESISWPCLEYHADLTQTLGVRYLWRGGLSPLPFQGTPLSFRNYLKRCANGKPGGAAREWLKVPVKLALGKPLVPTALAENPLMCPHNLRDGRRAWDIVRYGDFRRDAVEDLPQLLNAAALEALEASGGAALVYFHPGKRRNPGPLSPDVLGALQGIRDRFRSGHLLVATTARILAFYRLVRDLRWSARQDGEHLRILIQGIRDPVHGEEPAAPARLRGLCFYSEHPERTSIWLGDTQLVARAFPPDHTGKASIGFPWEPLDPSAWLGGRAA